MKKAAFLLVCMLYGLLLQAQERTVFDVARNGTVAEMRALMSKNSDLINSVDAKGFSPLILASYRGNTEVAEFLIENVKDVNYKSPEGTALAGLCIRYDKNLVEKLLAHHADPNIPDVTGTTPLIWAVKTGNEELVKMLLAHAAKKDQADNMGIKPFEYAVRTQRQNIINLLKIN